MAKAKKETSKSKGATGTAKGEEGKARSAASVKPGKYEVVQQFVNFDGDERQDYLVGPLGENNIHPSKLQKLIATGFIKAVPEAPEEETK